MKSSALLQQPSNASLFFSSMLEGQDGSPILPMEGAPNGHPLQLAWALGGQARNPR